MEARALRVGVALVALGGAVAGGRAAERPAILDVETIRTAQDAFQGARGEVRIVVLASPTSRFAVDSVRDLEREVAAIPAGALKIFVVWTPSNGADDLAVARARSASLPADGRTTFLWDARRQVASGMRRAFELSTLPDGMFLLYDRDADWKVDEPPLPTYWMQRGAGRGRTAPRFDPATFARRVRGLLEVGGKD